MRSREVRSRMVGALVPACAIVLLIAGPASAHSFLAATDPPQGARLAVAPDSVALQLSEAIIPSSVQVHVRRSDGTGVAAPPPTSESDGAVVRQPLPDVAPDVYVVSWHVTSAVDGHESAGELAFAVGTDVAADVPMSARGAPGVDPATVLLAWVFFTGLAVAFGGLTRTLHVSEDGASGRWWLRAGAATALAVVLIRSLMDGPPAAGVPGPTALALPISALLLGLTLPLARTGTAIPALLLTAAAAAWSTRSHSAATHGVAGAALDGLHLVAAAAWAGGLAQVAHLLWRDHRSGEGVQLEPVRRYAGPALGLVAVVSLSGVGQAALLLPGWSAVWSTPYGQVLIVKTGLLLAAVAAAAVARLRALPGGRGRLLRVATTTELWLVAGVLGVAALLVSSPPPTPTTAAASLLGPPPIDGPAVRAMGLAGGLTVDIAAGDGRLDVSVISPSGGVEGAAVDITAVLPDGTTNELHPRPCGPGCFTQELELPAGGARLQVTAAAPVWTGGRMEADVDWPPPPAQPERFEAMVQSMRAAGSVTVTESVRSSSAAADTAATEVTMTGAELVALMPWAGGGVIDVRPVDGQADAFTFYLPGSRMLFEVRTGADGRLRDQRMVNPGHEIGYRFTYGPAEGPSSPD